MFAHAQCLYRGGAAHFRKRIMKIQFGSGLTLGNLGFRCQKPGNDETFAGVELIS